MKNLVLIGMPGCGKTTVSKSLERMLKLPLIDIDQYLEDNCPWSIEEMFSMGEDFFREQETRMTRRLSQCHGTILACGGGIVLREENMRLLALNGRIYYLKRDIDKIFMEVDITRRPLLKKGRQELYTLYAKRRHLYEKYADVIVDNNGTIAQTTQSIQQDYAQYVKKKTV